MSKLMKERLSLFSKFLNHLSTESVFFHWFRLVHFDFMVDPLKDLLTNDANF